MNTIETIQEKVYHLPTKAQEEVLEAIEQIEKRYKENETSNGQNIEIEHPLTAIAKMAKDVGVSDLAERHGFYTNENLDE
ncbi:MAG: hypothetical protein ACR2MD_17270 [Aridibacter sp.]